MNIITKRLYIGLLFFLALVSFSAFAGTEPVEAFFSHPAKNAFSLSPDGHSLAWMSPWHGRANLFVKRPGGGEKQVTQVADRDISGYFWKGNDTLLYFKDNAGDEDFHLYRVDLKTAETVDLTPFPKVRVQMINYWPENEDNVIIAMNRRAPGLFDAWQLNIKTGQMTLLAQNPGDVRSWVADHQGWVRIAQTSSGPAYRNGNSGDFRHLLLLGKPSDHFDVLAFTADNRDFYVTSNVDRNTQALVLYDPDANKEIRTVFATPDVDVSEGAWSLVRNDLTCVFYELDLPRRYCPDQAEEQLLTGLEARFPGKQVAIWSRDQHDQRFVIKVWSDRLRGRLYLFDKPANTVELLTDLAPGLSEQKMAHMQPVEYKARDGLTIHGYLSLPAGKEGTKGLPVIVNPHGGPWLRDSWGFNSEVQFLASRGWAVLQINFRASTGFGRKFLMAGAKEWGGDMQDDITDGVDWLVKSGIADPRRICIYGASYGGFAALSGITKTPDLYRCAVDYSGISNLKTWLQSYPEYWHTLDGYMAVMVGSLSRDAFMLGRRSPINHVDDIKTPLLVIHGAQDPRVKVEEAQQIVDALHKRNIPVRFLLKQNEGHGFQNEENKLEAYQTMEGFFHEHLDASAPASMATATGAAAVATH